MAVVIDSTMRAVLPALAVEAAVAARVFDRGPRAVGARSEATAVGRITCNLRGVVDMAWRMKEALELCFELYTLLRSLQSDSAALRCNFGPKAIP